MSKGAVRLPKILVLTVPALPQVALGLRNDRVGFNRKEEKESKLRELQGQMKKQGTPPPPLLVEWRQALCAYRDLHHVILNELRQPLIPYQDYYMLFGLSRR